MAQHRIFGEANLYKQQHMITTEDQSLLIGFTELQDIY